ncbi:metal-dependent hydrolase [Paenibacillus sp. MER TA 81-3]|uniref:metal-dependent hydrolase n=1 Tax=Paenibacillus sp. MER TA 81-3 TaxID=2939573 RepID=UPI002040BE04|nr:metal-dependent hydrolase [Paenibacillus sp. MER TA 81-3]MCM3339773.1 metal-dependent hydrolase [Paenibacillus sp. MER TA 81-3]
MKGSTHLTIGIAVGAAAAVYYPFTFKNASLYIAVSALSALSADLDGPSILSSKIGKISRWLHEILLWLGVCLAAGVIYQYSTQAFVSQELSIVSVVVLLLGFVAKEGVTRNIMVSMVGCGLLYWGWTLGWNWLIGLGVFVAWVPWLSHRGMSHTIWATLLWGCIGWGLEQQLRIEGITAVSICGYASHLIADTLTPRGVKWLYPLSNRSFKIRL